MLATIFCSYFHTYLAHHKWEEMKKRRAINITYLHVYSKENYLYVTYILYSCFFLRESNLCANENCASFSSFPLVCVGWVEVGQPDSLCVFSFATCTCDREDMSIPYRDKNQGRCFRYFSRQVSNYGTFTAVLFNNCDCVSILGSLVHVSFFPIVSFQVSW